MEQNNYTQEYKEYVIKMVIDEGRKMKHLSRELEIPYSTLNKWVKAYRNKQSHANSEKEEYLTPSEWKKREANHQKELDALREENEILKKAMHIFTKNQM
jgi:transposase